mmetsp:Transcript_384/g.1585  ORF Transcript_384/g.1585 Transcript_384/m.1585 type:complete len:261 (-) Transcript_384:2852-3634(-)
MLRAFPSLLRHGANVRASHGRDARTCDAAHLLTSFFWRQEGWRNVFALTRNTAAIQAIVLVQSPPRWISASFFSLALALHGCIPSLGVFLSQFSCYVAVRTDAIDRILYARRRRGTQGVHRRFFPHDVLAVDGDFHHCRVSLHRIQSPHSIRRAPNVGFNWDTRGVDAARELTIEKYNRTHVGKQALLSAQVFRVTQEERNIILRKHAVEARNRVEDRAQRLIGIIQTRVLNLAHVQSLCYCRQRVLTFANNENLVSLLS